MYKSQQSETEGRGRQIAQIKLVQQIFFSCLCSSTETKNKIYHLQVAKVNFNRHIIDSAIALFTLLFVIKSIQKAQH